MSREDIEKLLGGYATGTLTPEERETLFAAALEDQRLFDALAREEPLRELLQDPIVKGRLQAGLEPAAPRGYLRWLRAAAWAVPAAGLAALVVVLIVGHVSRPPVQLAEVRQLRSEPVAPVPAPLAQTLEKRELPALARQAPQPSANVADTAAVTAAAPAVAAAAQSPLLPPPPPAPAAPPPPAPAGEPVQVAEAFGVQQSAGGVRPEAASARISGLGGAAPVQDARALFFGVSQPLLQFNALQKKSRTTPQAAMSVVDVAATPAPNLGLRYRILQASSTGRPVNPSEPLPRNEEFFLNLQPNAPGYLEVFERAPEGAWRLLESRAVQRLMTYDTPLDAAGARELFVVLTRQPQRTAYPVPEARLDQLQSFNPAEQASYVVSTGTSPPAQTLAFPITLTYK